MQFLFSLAVFAGLALAQNAYIGLPKAGQKVAPGSDVIVQVQRPNSLTNSEEMAVAIGFASCGSGGCYPTDEFMGTVVYNGKFNPVYHETYLPPYQNFTVTVPASFKAGKAQVNVAHATLIGAGLYPEMETLNQTIVIS
ncbi:hypothetical protein N7486_007373 [Penicillium sp. IBT 16267x]|nr:hypothetical protein N7486_007373 [Penicillium sp. IBT 16267x]